jgi:hypothetical protein
VDVVKLVKSGNETLTTKVFEFNVIYLMKGNVDRIVPVSWEDMNLYVEGRRRMLRRWREIS